MPTSSTLGVGTVRSGEQVIDFSPKFPSSTLKPGVAFVHGAGSNADYCISPYGNQGQLTNRIISEGYPGIAGDNGGQQTWGNATSATAMGQYLTRLQARPDAQSGAYALIGASMGGIVSLNYAAQATVKPRAIVLAIPVINPEDIRANNRSGYATFVNGAYGGAYNEATMGATYNPYTMRSMSKLTGIPMLIFYGATDALCLPTYAQQFVAADPTYRTGVSVPYGHEEAAYASVNQQQVIDFLNTYMG